MYCVNCGVELHKTAENCVLCGTVVINPNILTKEEIEHYKSYETSSKMSEKPVKPYGGLGTREKPPNYVMASVLVAILTTVSVTCFVINHLYSPQIQWSYIVASSSILLGVIILYPMLSKETSGYIYTTSVSTGIFLVMRSVSRLTLSNAWLYEFSLPLLILIAFETFLFIAVRRKFTIGILPSTALILILITIMQLCCEALISNLLHGKTDLEWSYIVAAACSSVAILIFFITLSTSLRNLFRKMFHL